MHCKISWSTDRFAHGGWYMSKALNFQFIAARFWLNDLHHFCNVKPNNLNKAYQDICTPPKEIAANAVNGYLQAAELA